MGRRLTTVVREPQRRAREAGRRIDRTEMMERSLAFMRLEGLRNGIARRFDRCCHPGKPGDGVLFFRRLAREMRE